MSKLTITVAVLLSICTLSFAQTGKQLITFEQLFPKSVQRQMGLHKLTDIEKEKLRFYVEKLLIKAIASSQSSGKAYAGVGGGHWIKTLIVVHISFLKMIHFGK